MANNAQTHDKMNTYEEKLPHWEQKLSIFLGEVHHHMWEPFLMNNYCSYLPSYLSQIWLKLVFEVAKLGSIPSWYPKTRFLVGSQMGPQEIPCCKVMSGSFERTLSPINFGTWTIPMSGSIILVVVSSMLLLWSVVTMLSSTLDRSDLEINWPFFAKPHLTFSAYLSS